MALEETVLSIEYPSPISVTRIPWIERRGTRRSNPRSYCVAATVADPKAKTFSAVTQ
jgi:hypothetical protein